MNQYETTYSDLVMHDFIMERWITIAAHLCAIDEWNTNTNSFLSSNKTHTNATSIIGLRFAIMQTVD